MPVAEQRIDFPSTRKVSEDVLEDFRTIDPTVELLYLGGKRGMWVLGSVKPMNVFRQQQAEGFAQQGERLFYAFLQGFKPIELYTSYEVEEGLALRDFRVRDWMFRVSGPWFEEYLKAKVLGDPRRQTRAEQRLDQIQSEYKSIHAFCFRDRRSHRVDGSKKGEQCPTPTSTAPQPASLAPV